VPALAERPESFAALSAAFDAFRQEPAFLGNPQSREWAFKRFQDEGLPTTRDEEWRFTNVAPIGRTRFVRAGAATVRPADLAPFRFPGVPAVVLVNGRLDRTLSALAELPAGLTLTSSHDSPWSTSMGAFPDLNAAFFEQVVTLTIASGAVVSTPVQVLSVVVGSGTAALVAPRLVVRAGERAECQIIEDYVGLGDGVTLTTAVTDLLVEAGAFVRHVKIQREAPSAFHLATLKVHLERASVCHSSALTFGARISRDDITAVLQGEGAECTLHGLYVATGDRLVDTHTTIDHAAPHCPSHEIYKGVLAGHARAVFNGKILVRPLAQKTDAKQTNKALLLSDEAQVNTKPQLEIFADDVKCTHGAAIGQLDEDALFYLRARGVAESDARHMLIEAFAGQILEGLGVPVVRDVCQALLEATLAEATHA
jgi:Fe-S cluster assembly protein SufD